MSNEPTIIYTKTDEAPLLATYSFLPVIRAFAKHAGVDIELRDISLAGRLLAAFPEHLTEEQRVSDHLAELGQLAKRPEANIIKLPNISASVPQMKEAIEELQAKGFALPDYPEEPSNDEEAAIKKRYDKVKGSAVNPVLREGNSDRRAPAAVKEYARNNPHRMGAWPKDSKTNVGTMSHGDFRSNEQSRTIASATTVRIVHETDDGQVTALKHGLALQEAEIIDASVLSKAALTDFLAKQIQAAADSGLLFSLHMKATMMKVSDPIIFGHAVKVYFADVFEKYAGVFNEIGVDANNGLSDVYDKISALDEAKQSEIRAALEATMKAKADLAMVDSDRGITNLHVPNDVIIDASMPAMVRAGGQMWDHAGKTRETLAVIPDSSYAGVYQAVVDYCRENGAFDPTTMGSVPNVGLMAQKAEEYGSHDKTFEIETAGTVRVINEAGEALTSHRVAPGDIWRMCQVKDAPVRDWVKLAVSRAKATGATTVFWLNAERPHDAELIKKVDVYLQDHDTNGLDIRTLSPVDATKLSCERLTKGLDTVSATGNVLRDYLTDLFPILEVGTSAKMLSIVPLMNGGGLFETGAGGSAPKHVQQFVEENHLRWDSLGEFLALAVSFEHLATRLNHRQSQILGETLNQATTHYLLNNKSPSRKVNELDNRGSHFYVALYWAQGLAGQSEDAELQAAFAPLATALADKETAILAELNEVQGRPMDIGGYYLPDDEKASTAMRPSATFNSLIG